VNDNNQLLESLIYPHVKEILFREIKSLDTCLELGCGSGQYRLVVPGKYIGSDITAQNYRPELPRRIDIVADAQALPFKDDSFDVVFIVAALYQIPDVEAVMTNVYRILRNEGKFLIFDYNYRTTKRLKNIENDGINKNHVWTPWGLKRKVKETGFQAKIVYLYGQDTRIAWKKWLFRFKFIVRLLMVIPLREGWNIVIGVKTASDGR
jgi:ubiquinone/menaquinone biosynthesis C-methylase UbiE